MPKGIYIRTKYHIKQSIKNLNKVKNRGKYIRTKKELNQLKKQGFKKGIYQGYGFKKGHIPTHGFKKGHPKPKGAYSFPKGKNNPAWNGGRKKDMKGYIFILKHNHPSCDNKGYVRRSHLVMEKHLGRYLTPEEIVHHKGIKYPLGSIKNRQDDRPENLQLFANKSSHMKFHKSLNFVSRHFSPEHPDCK